MSGRFRVLVLSLWPGLAQVLTGQEGLGLILAALFALALNLAIASRFVWTELFAPGWSALFAAMAAGTWASTAGYTAWWCWRCHPERHGAEIDRLYRDAMGLYLKGRWAEASGLLERLLDRDEADADALMLLGTLYARAGRDELARRAFRQCRQHDEAGKWAWEVGRELARLDGR